MSDETTTKPGSVIYMPPGEKPRLVVAPEQPGWNHPIGSIGAVWLIGGQGNDEEVRGLPRLLLRVGWAEYFRHLALQACAFGAQATLIRNPGGVVKSEGLMVFDQLRRMLVDPEIPASLKSLVAIREAFEIYGVLARHQPDVYLGNPVANTDWLGGMVEIDRVSEVYARMAAAWPIDSCRRVVFDGLGSMDDSSTILTIIVTRDGWMGVEPIPHKPWNGFDRWVSGYMQSNYFRAVCEGEYGWTINPDRNRSLDTVFVEEPVAPTIDEVALWAAMGYSVLLPCWGGRYLGASAADIRERAVKIRATQHPPVIAGMPGFVKPSPAAVPPPAVEGGGA